MRLTRRHMLAASAGAGMAAAVPLSSRASTRPAPLRMVIDPTLPAATRASSLAESLGIEYATQGHDLASLLYGRGRHWLAPGTHLLGVTGHAGFMVANGIARERRLPQLSGWVLEAGGPRALPGSTPLPAALAPLARHLPADGRAILWEVMPTSP